MQDGAKIGTHRDLLILRGALENASEAFITIDENSTVIFYNKAAERIFGYAAGEVQGQNLAVILSHRCRAGHDEAVARYVDTRRGKLIGHQKEFEMVRKGGEAFTGSISFSVVEIEGRLYFTGIVRDITKETRLREELDKAERLAALGQAVAEINHEIKNPLAMIGGFARQLDRKIQGDKEREKIRIIIGEVDRLEKLLAEMGDLYMPKKGALESFCLRELVEEVHALVKSGGDGAAVTFKIVEEGDYFRISADRQKLKQVLLNILKNAVEAMGGKGDIIVNLGQGEGTVSITVVDAGHGIPTEIQEKIFKPFFTTKKQGTGLGLPISKRIVEEHCGGVLSIKSEEGKGTAVTIILNKGL